MIIVPVINAFIQIFIFYCFMQLLYKKEMSKVKHVLFTITVSLVSLGIIIGFEHYSQVPWALYTTFQIGVIALGASVLCQVPFVSMKSISSFPISTIYIGIIGVFVYIPYVFVEIIIGMVEILTPLTISNQIVNIMWLALARIIEIAVYFYVRKKIKENVSFHISPNYVNFVCMTYYAILAIVSINIYDIEEIMMDIDVSLQFFLNMIFVLAILLFIVYVSYRISKAEVEGKNNELMKMKNEMLQQNLMQMKHASMEKAQVYHDMKNHLALTYEWVLKGETEKALQYMEDIIEPLQVQTEQIQSGNDIVDLIISMKKRTATESGVSMEVKYSPLQQTDINAMDLCAIIGNLLDNAIEACQKIDTIKERYIGVGIAEQNQFLTIKVINTVHENPLQNNPRLHTIKKNIDRHGVGLKSVQASVKKYHGDFSYAYKDGMFEVVVLLML